MTRLLIVIAVFSAVIAPLFASPKMASAYTFPTLSFVFPTFEIPEVPAVPTFSFPQINPTQSTSSTPKPTPTKTPSPTHTPTPKPTATSRPISTSTPQPSKTPSPTPKPLTSTPAPTSSSSSVKDYIMNAINNYRKSLGLSLVKTDSYTCNFAAIRAKEISSGFNHDGFTNRINNHTLPYPSYQQITENIAMTSNYQNVVNMWVNSPGHAENMRRDTPNVCVEKYGNYYAYEGWKP